MLPEMLLTVGCLVGGCKETLSAYKAYNPTLYEGIENRIEELEIKAGVTGRYFVSVMGVVTRKQLFFQIEKDSFVYIDVRETASLGIRVNF